MQGYEGVERVSSMGKYGICGRVYFNNKDVMWGFIKGNKRTKFEHDGVNGVDLARHRKDDGREADLHQSWLRGEKLRPV